MRSAETLPHFAADYLAWRHEVQPTAATFDGVHVHDDLLEDFSRASIDRQIRDLNGFARRLASMSSDATLAERADHSALMANAQARLHELEVIRTWERDPQLYADTLATSLAAQAIFTYAPAAERARRLLSKLRQVAGVLDAARTNVREPAGIFIKTAAETLRGVVSFLNRDLPRALREVDDLSLLADLDDASTVAKTAIERYVRDLEEEQAPKAKATFRIGKDKIEHKLKLEDGVTLDTDALLRIAFLTFSLMLFFPVLFVYQYPQVLAILNLAVSSFTMAHGLTVLTTITLYLVACDPLPPCQGKVREWLGALVPARPSPTAVPEDQG